MFLSYFNSLRLKPFPFAVGRWLNLLTALPPSSASATRFSMLDEASRRPWHRASGPGPGWLLWTFLIFASRLLAGPCLTATETVLCITINQPASCVLCLRASKIPKLSAQGENHENPTICEANQDPQNLKLLHIRYVIQLLGELSLCPSLEP